MPLGKEVGLGSGDTVLYGAHGLNFQPMPIVAKRSPISATAELLFLCVYLCMKYPENR